MPLTLILRKVEGLEDQLWQVMATGAPSKASIPPRESNQFTCCSTFSSYQLIHGRADGRHRHLLELFFLPELGTDPAIEAKLILLELLIDTLLTPPFTDSILGYPVSTFYKET